MTTYTIYKGMNEKTTGKSRNIYIIMGIGSVRFMYNIYTSKTTGKMRFVDVGIDVK